MQSPSNGPAPHWNPERQSLLDVQVDVPPPPPQPSRMAVARTAR